MDSDLVSNNGDYKDNDMDDRHDVAVQPTHKRKLGIESVATAKRRLKSYPNGSINGTHTNASSFEKHLEKLGIDSDEYGNSLDECLKIWKRPDLPPIDPKSYDIRFQQIETLEGQFCGNKNTVQLFGVTEDHHSVLLHVTGLQHYLYIAAPAAFKQEDCEGFKSYIDDQMSYPCVQCVEIVMKENLYGYQGNHKTPYLKITAIDPSKIFSIRSKLESRNFDYRGMWGHVDGGLLTFDNVQYGLRFMIDCHIVGMSWVEAPAGKYRVLGEREKYSTCQIEAQIHYKDLIAHQPEGEWAKIGPIRILSFDIECVGRKGIFPEAKQDSVIQIANVVNTYGDMKSSIRNVFCLNTCNPIAGSQVLEFSTEQAMLLAWRDFMEACDPDMVIGYNISNFDLPYLLERATHLRINRFPYLGRLKNVSSEAHSSNFSSKQMGNRDTKVTNLNGRLQLDLLLHIQRDHQLRSYTLNSVSAHFLNEQKEDVQHTMIAELFHGDSNTRRRLAIYCLKDAYLPQRLLDMLMCVANYSEMARVTGVPFNFLLLRGQQIKFMSQMYRRALKNDLVIPNVKSEASDDQYEGATVIEPIRGYYDVPIATLDFASLYPSIIIAHNLCYTTLLNRAAVVRYNLKKDEDYIVTPAGEMFCKATVRKGLLAEILEFLLSARKKAKEMYKTETEPLKKAVLNGRQLALKISANSIYGLTGATIGKLPCIAIASSTTGYGRKMIELTKQIVEEQYTTSKGYSYNAQVIYGDTDSVMVKFGSKDIREVMKLGEEAAEFVSNKFPRPIHLEFEKVFYPYLLINKKRYAGLIWTSLEKWDKMDTKGIETVRRDNCRLVQTVIETSLNKLLIERDVKGAEDYVKQIIADLLQNKIDMSNLVITKALSKLDYVGKQAHVELAERMRKRDLGSAPTLGDRVAYVIIKGSGTKNYERSEDPLYVLENNLPIDTKYYLENQLSKPLIRIFEPILGERRANQLLSGEHTRTVSVAAPTTGGLTKFTQKTLSCMGCKKPLVNEEEKDGAVCVACRPRITELYMKSLHKLSNAQVKFARLWTQCQTCQGSLHNEIICSNRDCPIFYMRIKSIKDAEHATKETARFDHDKALLW